jgi:hypothetical protein
LASIFLCSRSTLRASSQKNICDDDDDIEKEGKKMKNKK